MRARFQRQTERRNSIFRMRRSPGKRTTQSWQAKIPAGLRSCSMGRQNVAKPTVLLGTVLGTARETVQKIQLNQRLEGNTMVEPRGIEPLTS